MTGTGAEAFDWRPVRTTDFPLLAVWLARPHVQRWWNHETDPESVARDFGAAVRGEEPGEDLLVLRDGRPFGLVQRCRLDDYPEDRDAIAAIADVPPGAMCLDYLVGDPADTGRGLGTAMIAFAVGRTRADHLVGDLSFVIPIAAGNRPSWRALERVGFVRVGRGDLPPDNPIDPPDHLVYRLDIAD